ncbi:hypothetical protein NL676_033477 [Syzygium grande]|nr:hypothetical protein NL676_033477 [Syzygium grande]
MLVVISCGISRAPEFDLEIVRAIKGKMRTHQSNSKIRAGTVIETDESVKSIFYGETDNRIGSYKELWKCRKITQESDLKSPRIKINMKCSLAASKSDHPFLNI